MNCIPCRQDPSQETTCSINHAFDANSPLHDVTYQYIVIGGGTSGCPLAAVLAKNGKTFVLERGKAKEPDNTLTSYSKERAIQTSRTEDGSWAISANVLGGASVINAGVFMKETQGRRVRKGATILGLAASQ
jgi:(R)-mandelonitrile lyase